MSIVLDIVGGLFIGGFLMIIALTATDTATTEFYNYNSDAIIQQNLSSMSEVIQYDLRKMGFGIPEQFKSTILQTAQPSHLKFLAHLNSNPICKIGDPNVTTIDNIVDSIEYRVVQFDSIDYVDTMIVTYQIRRDIFVSPGYHSSIGIGIIGNQNAFRYLDQIGRPVAVINQVQMVEVTLTAYDPRIVLSTDWIDSKVNEVGYNEEFRKRELRRLLRASYWRQTRLISKNLKR